MTRLVCRKCASDILNWNGVHCPFCGRKLKIENEDYWDEVEKVLKCQK